MIGQGLEDKDALSSHLHVDKISFITSDVARLKLMAVATQNVKSVSLSSVFLYVYACVFVYVSVCGRNWGIDEGFEREKEKEGVTWSWVLTVLRDREFFIILFCNFLLLLFYFNFYYLFKSHISKNCHVAPDQCLHHNATWTILTALVENS